MRTKLPLLLVALGIGVTLFVGALRRERGPSQQLESLKERITRKHVPSVDHAKLQALQKPFASPGEVTRACISCHTERAIEVMRSSHWNWEREEYIEGRGIRYIGKRNILNNYCIGIAGNEETCNKCHIGYGWKDTTFQFGKPDNVDCLACHDNTGTYAKTEGDRPDPSVNLTTVAQHVGRPTRANCGMCHFYGGGGNNVKHGDLEDALLEADRSVDVHMAVDGANLSCVACHTAENHRIMGKLYSVSSMNRNRSSCEQCHTAEPHPDNILNEHVGKIACQTCHIPSYAKVHSTKLSWDWSTAGRLRDGKPFELKDSLGNAAYLSIKGSFVWGRNVVPEYVWFNGTASHYLLGDTASPGRPIRINAFNGDIGDPEAKIIPVKIHRTKQPFDPVFRTLIQPKLYAPTTGQGAFWKDFDWQRSAEEGMKSVGLPFSGTVHFVNTEMTWPVNHMVAPKEKSVGCAECHTREKGRLAGIRGFYLPGRDVNNTVDGMGFGLVALAFTGVVVHLAARVRARRKNMRRTRQ